MKNYVFHFIVLFCLLSLHFKSQNDVINTIKGDKVICKITKEDSARVYFKVGGELGKVEASITRNEIRSIEYAPKETPKPPPLTMNPANIDHDDYVAPPTSTNTIPAPQKTATPLKKSFNTCYLKIGGSIPVGKFEKQKLDTNEIGPGMPGQMIDIGFSHHTNKNLGITVNGFYAQNELNTVPILAKYKASTDSVWHADKAYWRSVGINVGVFVFKEVNDFLFFAKLNAGYLSLKHPELKLDINSAYYLNYQTVSSDALSFGGGAGLSYKLLENLNLVAEISYLQARCKFNEVLIIGEEPGTPYPKKISITQRDVIQNYQNIFTSIGLSYRF